MPRSPNKPNILPIEDVAELFDRPVATVRSWHRRYGLVSSEETRSGPGGGTSYDVPAIRKLAKTLAKAGKLARYNLPEDVAKTLLHGGGKEPLARTLMTRLREGRAAQRAAARPGARSAGVGADGESGGGAQC